MAQKEQYCALTSLFAAMIQTDPLSPLNRSPFGIDNGWRWIATILNMDPIPMTPSLLASFMEANFSIILLDCSIQIV